MDEVAGVMADTLISALTAGTLPPEVARLYLTNAIGDLSGVGALLISGGVGEYVYGREDRDFGDMGRRLGHALRRRLESGALPWPLLPAAECIRATALGASEYSVQLSGNTTYISDPATLLPRRNLQILQPPIEFAETIDPAEVAGAILTHRTAFDLHEGDGAFGLAFRWAGAPSYERLAALAEGIRRGLADRITRGDAVCVMLDGDVAQTLGALLKEELAIDSEVLVIDGVTLWDFDFIDLGRIRLPSRTVPVTIKSLVFSEDPRGPRPSERLHHHAEHDHGHHRHGHHHDGAHGHHDHGHDHHHHRHEHHHPGGGHDHRHESHEHRHKSRRGDADDSRAPREDDSAAAADRRA
jgi:ethanolamine utilization protein EutA